MRLGVSSIALYYISLLSGLGNMNIDDQNRNPNINNRDHLVGQPTKNTQRVHIALSQCTRAVHKFAPKRNTMFVRK